MTGLVNRHSSLPLQLKASSIFAEVNGFAARVLATLTYYNECDYDAEGLFVFPQDERTSVVEFEATIEERHVFTDIRDLNGQKTSDKSVYSVEEREDDLFSVSIGRIPAHCSVFAQVTLITELLADHQTRGSLFILPSVFTPRLATGEDQHINTKDLYGSQILISDMPRKTYEPYSFELQLEVAAPCLLAGCSSPTHAIQVDADYRATNASRIHITIAEPHTYDCELVVLLHLSHPSDPYVLIEEGKKEMEENDSPSKKNIDSNSTNLISEFTKKPSIMINYTPLLNFSNQTAEYIFLVDRSGSMSGKHIFQVKEMLILFLKSLPTKCYFNLIGFGSYYRSLFPESQCYTETSAEKACSYVQKMRADLGGTNLISPLEFIFDQPVRRGIPRFVFLLTDGGVSNTVEVVDYVRRNSYSTRFYTFGIGPEACPHLVQGVAGATKGKAWFISEDDRIPPKVMSALKDAMKPAVTDLEVSWHLPEGYDIVQTPHRVPIVLDGERLVIYGILSRPAWEEREPPRTPIRRRIDCSMRSFSNNSVKVFWFDDDLEYLPDEELLLEIDEHEKHDDDEGNDAIGLVMASSDGQGHVIVNDGKRELEQYDIANGTDRSCDGSLYNSNDLLHNLAVGALFEEGVDYSSPRENNNCEIFDYSMESCFALPQVEAKGDGHQNEVDIARKRANRFSRESQFTLSQVDANGEGQQSEDNVANKRANRFSRESQFTFPKVEGKGEGYQSETDGSSSGEQFNVTVMKASFHNKGRYPRRQRRVEGSPEKNERAPIDENAADQQQRQAYQRDSGVGFSMDEAERANGDEAQSPANEQAKSLPEPENVDEETRLPAEGEIPEEETCEEPDDNKVRVFKNSPVLAQLGMPKSFGAINIRGFSGDEEVDRTIPFPAHHSGGYSKRPTIHQLMARSLIRERQGLDHEKSMREMRRISRQAKVHCRLTSFVSVDQYCYEDEILSALQHTKKGETPAPGHRRICLMRKGGFTAGLGRRLPTPEGSDQDEQWLTMSPGVDEEPVDLYRLDRTTTGDSSDDSPKKYSISYLPQQLKQGPRVVPPLSSRYVVGEKTTSLASNKKSIGGRISPIHMKCLKEYKPFVVLANLQSYCGSWELDESLADCLGLTLDNLQKASPLADSSVVVREELEDLLSEDKCDYGAQLWATVLALSWLQRHASNFKDEWLLLAQKANIWLGEHRLPRGFTGDDLKSAAFQALVLMQKKKQAKTEHTWDKVGENDEFEVTLS